MRLNFILVALFAIPTASAFSMSMTAPKNDIGNNNNNNSRRAFLTKAASTTAAAIIGGTTTSTTILPSNVANAAPEIMNTPSGLKYAVTRQPPDPKKATVPQKGDIVAIEYTGYLTSGQIFDATHAGE